MDPATLEDLLSRPTPAAVDAVRDLDGDLIVLGAGGKMGPSFAHLAVRAMREAGNDHSVLAVARFSDPASRAALEAFGAKTIACDLLDPSAVASLPDAAGVAFLAGTKFGTSQQAAATWAINATVPGIVAARYAGVPTVVFSSGNVYPFVATDSGGADESTPVSPIGEYAWSVVARERVFEHFAHTHGTKTAIYRLNYATDLRYGVPVDIAQRVFRGAPIDLRTGYVNMIWQGDANAMALACLGHAAAPPSIFNVTGTDTISVRELAQRFGRAFKREPVFDGEEQDTALLSNSSKACALFGAPAVSTDEIIEWTADWIRAGGALLDKPTHFETRDGAF